MRRFRKNNPLSAAYASLRDHARERGILFTISFLQFSCIARISQYATQKGLERTALTVDRKDNLRGYEPENLKVMTRFENIEKQAKRDAKRMAAGYAWQSRYAWDSYV